MLLRRGSRVRGEGGMKIVGVVMLLAAAYFVPRSDSDREDEKKARNQLKRIADLAKKCYNPEFMGDFEKALRSGGLPDAFGFSNTGVFAVIDESQFGSQSHKHEAAVPKDSEFAKEHPDLKSTFENIKTYAFSYPSEAYEYGAWLYHDKDEKLLASRPIGGLLKAQPADEWFVKKWEGTVLVDTDGKDLVDAEGENKICWMKMPGSTLFKQYEDVAAYCWAPNCLMLENNGDKNDGCLVFKMKDSTVGWTAYVWSLQDSKDKEPPSGDEQDHYCFCWKAKSDGSCPQGGSLHQSSDGGSSIEAGCCVASDDKLIDYLSWYGVDFYDAVLPEKECGVRIMNGETWKSSTYKVTLWNETTGDTDEDGIEYMKKVLMEKQE